MIEFGHTFTELFSKFSITSFGFFAFIAISLIAYYAIPIRLRWVGLLGSSIAFFVISCGTIMLFHLAYGVIVTFVGAALLDKKCKTESLRKITFTITLILAFSQLFILREINFFIVSAGHFGELFNIHFGLNQINLLAPIGISYYMLSLISYITDVYRGVSTCQTNILKHALFTCYFPMLTSGPIIRYGETGMLLCERHSFSFTRVKHGVCRMIWGVFKKLVIADRLAILINTVYADTTSYAGFYIIVAVVLFAIQLYCEFSGCMDIVLGASETFGIKLPENFNTPFFSKNIQEFWQRWHITLGFWSKDYILYPLLKSAPMQAIGKKSKKRFGKKIGKKIPTYITLVFVWSFIGIWHGGSVKFFVLSGVIPGIYLVGADLISPTFFKLNSLLRININNFAFKLFQCIRTVSLMLLPWTLVSADSLKAGLIALRNIFATFNPQIIFDGSLFNLGINLVDMCTVCIAVIVVFIVDVLHYKGVKIRETLDDMNIAIRWAIIYMGIFSTLIFGVYGGDAAEIVFLYARF